MTRKNDDFNKTVLEIVASGGKLHPSIAEAYGRKTGQHRSILDSLLVEMAEKSNPQAHEARKRTHDSAESESMPKGPHRS